MRGCLSLRTLYSKTFPANLVWVGSAVSFCTISLLGERKKKIFKSGNLFHRRRGLAILKLLEYGSNSPIPKCQQNWGLTTQIYANLTSKK